MSRWIARFLPKVACIQPDIPDILPSMSGLSGIYSHSFVKNDSFKMLTDENEKGFYEERAAILEYEAGYSRKEAECLAFHFTSNYFQSKLKH